MSAVKTTKINRLVMEWPRGAVGTAAHLKSWGYSYDLLKKYKESGWINSFGRGAYKRTDLDFNDIADASTHNTFIPAVRNVVDAPGRTLVIWVHGIDDDNLKNEIVEMGIKKDVQCLIGYGPRTWIKHPEIYPMHYLP